MELLFRYFFNRRELVDARVVDQDVEAAEILDGGVDDALRFRCLGNITTDSDSLAAGCCDRIDDGSRAGLARRVIDHHRRACSGERLGDGGPDTFGCACDHCYLTLEFAHFVSLSKFPCRIGGMKAVKLASPVKMGSGASRIQ